MTRRTIMEELTIPVPNVKILNAMLMNSEMEGVY
jgi:hypothetical protein